MRLVDEMNKLMEESYQDIMDAPGWTYHDTPRMDKEFWNELVDIIGEENIKIISGSLLQRQKGPEIIETFRCSFMMSPEGMENLKEYKLNKLKE